MKFTERFFEFPVRVYDRYSAERAEEKEKNLDTPMEGDWREGLHKMSHRDIKTWSDFFDSEQGVEGVDNDGFITTLVCTNAHEYYICTLNKADFEARLDDYVAKFEAWVDAEMARHKATYAETGRLALPPAG